MYEERIVIKRPFLIVFSKSNLNPSSQVCKFFKVVFRINKVHSINPEPEDVDDTRK